MTSRERRTTLFSVPRGRAAWTAGAFLLAFALGWIATGGPVATAPVQVEGGAEPSAPGLPGNYAPPLPEGARAVYVRRDAKNPARRFLGCYAAPGAPPATRAFFAAALARRGWREVRPPGGLGGSETGGGSVLLFRRGRAELLLRIYPPSGGGAGSGFLVLAREPPSRGTRAGAAG